MKAALEYPIAMINDIFAFQLPGATDAVKNKTVDLCVMRKGMPDSLHRDKQYKDVINEVYLFLDEEFRPLKMRIFNKKSHHRSRVWFCKNC